MKKKISIVIVIVLTLSFVGCIGPKKQDGPGLDLTSLANGYRTLSLTVQDQSFGILLYVGDWQLSHATYQGTTMSAGELDMEASFLVQFDGRIEFTFKGETAIGTSTEKDGKLLISDTSTSETIPAELRDGKMLVEYDGVEMYFERK